MKTIPYVLQSLPLVEIFASIVAKRREDGYLLSFQRSKIHWGGIKDIYIVVWGGIPWG